MIEFDAEKVLRAMHLRPEEVTQLLGALRTIYSDTMFDWIEANVNIIVHETDRCNGEGHQTELDWA